MVNSKQLIAIMSVLLSITVLASAISFEIGMDTHNSSCNKVLTVDTIKPTFYNIGDHCYTNTGRGFTIKGAYILDQTPTYDIILDDNKDESVNRRYNGFKHDLINGCDL